MFITDISITKFGIITGQHMNALPNGLVIIYGKNEAGKSTLSTFLRCMLCGIPKSRNAYEYKILPAIEQGFTGTIHVQPRTLYHEPITLYRSHSVESKNKNEVSLQSEHGLPLDTTLWQSLLGGNIDLEVYRNIFGISLSELVDVPKDGQAMREKLYGASLGVGVRTPSEILKILDEKSKELYVPKGSSGKVNQLLDSLLAVEKARTACLDTMEEYEHLRKEYTTLIEEQKTIDNEIANVKKTLHKVRKYAEAYPTWKKVYFLKEQLAQHKPYHGFSSTTERDFSIVEHEIQNCENALSSLQIQIKVREDALTADTKQTPLLDEYNAIKTLEEHKVRYQDDIDKHAELQTTIQYLEKQITEKLRNLGSDWDRERVRSHTITFTMEQEIAQQKTQLDRHDSNIDYKRRTLDDARTALYAIEQNLAIPVEKKNRLQELPIIIDFLETIEKNKERIRILEEKQYDKAGALHKEMRAVSPEWNDKAMRSCAPNKQDVLRLQSCITQYAQKREEKKQIEEKSKRIAIEIEIIENDIYSLIARKEESSIEDPEAEQKTIRTLRELVFLEHTARTQNAENSNAIKGFTTFLLFICTSIFIAFFLPAYTWVLLSVGSIASVILSCGIYFYLEQQKRQKIRLKLGGSGCATIEELAEIIQIESASLGLSEASNELLTTIEVAIANFLEMENRIKELQKKLLEKREQQQHCFGAIAEKEDEISHICTIWTDALHLSSMPPLSPEYTELDNFLTRIQDIHTLIQEENRFIAEMHTLQDTQDILYNEIMMTETAQYMCSTELTSTSSWDAVLRCLERHAKEGSEELQEQKTLEKDKSRLQEKIYRLEQEMPSLEEESRSKAEWQQWLTEYGYPNTLTPVILLQCIEYIKEIQKEDAEQKRHIETCTTIQRRVQSFECEVASILGLAPVEKTAHLYAANAIAKLECLSTLVLEEQNYSTNRSQVRKEQENDVREYEALQKKSEELKKKKQLFFTNTNTVSDEDFRTTNDAWLQYKTLQAEITTLEQSLKEIIHPETIQSIAVVLESCSEEEIKNQIERHDATLTKLGDQKTGIAEHSGKIQERITQAEKGEITTYTLEYAQITTEIDRYMKAWYTLRATREIVLQAQKQFEEERQPHVMKLASTFIETITNTTWNAVFRSAEDSIKLRNASGLVRFPTELSRGTQEQVYFALRLAGACTHALTTQEPLPLVFDDITVNFDITRAKGVAKVIQALTEGAYKDIPAHQIFFFTCHEHIAHMLEEMVPNSKLFALNSGIIQKDIQ